MIDLVVDTNVLKDASNPEAINFSDALELVRELRNADTVLCVDEGFSIDANVNRSLIGAEYLKHLVTGMVGYHLIVHLIQRDRLRMLPLIEERAVKKFVVQSIRNKRDRTFLLLAATTQERTLVSHDYTDFQVHKRASIRKEIDVRVIEAGVALTKLRGAAGSCGEPDEEEAVEAQEPTQDPGPGSASPG